MKEVTCLLFGLLFILVVGVITHVRQWQRRYTCEELRDSILKVDEAGILRDAELVAGVVVRDLDEMEVPLVQLLVNVCQNKNVRVESLSWSRFLCFFNYLLTIFRFIEILAPKARPNIRLFLALVKKNIYVHVIEKKSRHEFILSSIFTKFQDLKKFDNHRKIER